jgi:hypothetical protein
MTCAEVICGLAVEVYNLALKMITTRYGKGKNKRRSHKTLPYSKNYSNKQKLHRLMTV